MRGCIGISMIVWNTNPASIQDNRHRVAMDFREEGGYFFDLIGCPPSYFGFEMKTVLLTVMLSSNYQKPMYVDITRLHFVCRE